MPCSRMLLAIACILVHSAVHGQTIGWRGDGTGTYPKANPPTEWGLDKNVAWKIAMPSFSVGTPVIVVDKIFTCSEPTTLVCLNKADGRILWERKCLRSEIAWSEEDRRKLVDERAQDDTWAQEMRGAEQRVAKFEKAAKESPEKAKEMRKDIDALRTQVSALRAKRKSLSLLQRATEPYRDGTAGYSQCTPVSDGKRIYAMFGNGLVACFDLDGTRRWLTLMEHSTADYGHGSSPVLVGGRLIVHFADLVGLDVENGKESWRLKARPLHGTSIPATIDGVDVVVTPGGMLVRASDGLVLADKLGSCGDNAPIVHGNIVYFIAGSSVAVRLPAKIDEKPEQLWKSSLKGGDYWFSSPVLRDGLIYAVNGNRNFNVLNAGTGKSVFSDRLEVEGRIYPSICSAGKFVFVSSDSGTTIVLEPGREYKEVARNQLETFRSTPIFEGRRMYVRTQKNLCCIGE